MLWFKHRLPKRNLLAHANNDIPSLLSFALHAFEKIQQLFAVESILEGMSQSHMFHEKMNLLFICEVSLSKKKFPASHFSDMPLV